MNYARPTNREWAKEIAAEVDPKYLEALDRVLLAEIQKFFENEGGQRELKEWKEQREKQL